MLKVIDLFAGAGGLSLGAARAGFKVSAAVELDPFAFETHSNNFQGSAHLQENVAELSGKELLRLAGLSQGELDGLIGGPPCQGFSSMGRRDVEDNRNNLFQHFFRLVVETAPSFFVAENVPGILDPRYDEIRRLAFAQLPDDYVVLSPIEVKADLYGAPTTRTRIFFIGYKPNKFSKEMSPADFLPSMDIQPTYVEHALTGLPSLIESHWLTEEQGWRSVSKIGDDFFLSRVKNAVPHGIGNPAQLARYFEQNLVSGCMGTRHSEEVQQRYEALKYGQVDKISKSVKLNPKGFCPTLRAGTGKDKGSYQAVRPIHYASGRVITPREAARLQGFPDWFVFHRTKWHSFRQIGNSVSPIVSESILSAIFNNLK